MSVLQHFADAQERAAVNRFQGSAQRTESLLGDGGWPLPVATPISGPWLLTGDEGTVGKGTDLPGGLGVHATGPRQSVPRRRVRWSLMGNGRRRRATAWASRVLVDAAWCFGLALFLFGTWRLAEFLANAFSGK